MKLSQKNYHWISIVLLYSAIAALALFVLKLISLWMIASPEKVEPLIGLVIVISLMLVYAISKIRSSAKYRKEVLSKREREIIPLLLSDRSNKEICEKLYIAPSTLKSHINRIYKKLGVKSRSELREISI